MITTHSWHLRMRHRMRRLRQRNNRLRAEVERVRADNERMRAQNRLFDYLFALVEDGHGTPEVMRWLAMLVEDMESEVESRRVNQD